MEELTKLSLSIDCSLGDDEDKRSSHCENVRQLKDDMDSAIKLIPGMHRINIGADCYITDDIISIDELEPRHFDEWVSWGKTKVKGIDITSSMRNHEMADTGYTLSSEDKGIRYFWIEHAAACRAIGEKFGVDMISPSFVNIHVYDKLKYSDAAVTDRQNY